MSFCDEALVWLNMARFKPLSFSCTVVLVLIVVVDIKWYRAKSMLDVSCMRVRSTRGGMCSFFGVLGDCIFSVFVEAVVLDVRFLSDLQCVVQFGDGFGYRQLTRS